MDSALNLGKVFGIQLRLHYSWFVIFVLVTVSLVFPAWSQWSYWVMGIATSLLFFSSVVAHELAHSLVGKANGIPITSITLFIFGGIAQMTREAARPGAEFKMAAAGPACSLAIGGLFFLILSLVPDVTGPVATMLQWLAYINFALAAFNLIPGFPLDGGRVFRAILWRATGNYTRSTRIATRMGQVVGYLFILGGILIIFFQPFGLSWFSGLWLAFIGWFLGNAASASYRQNQWREALHEVSVAQVMTSDAPVVPSDITVNRLVQGHVFPGGHQYFMVVDEDRLKGVLTLHSIKSVPQQYWEVTQAKDIMTPVDKLKTAHLDQDVLSVLEQMNESNVNQIPVVNEGRVVGLIARDNLIRFLRTHSGLGA